MQKAEIRERGPVPVCLWCGQGVSLRRTFEGIVCHECVPEVLDEILARLEQGVDLALVRSVSRIPDEA